MRARSLIDSTSVWPYSPYLFTTQYHIEDNMNVAPRSILAILLVFSVGVVSTNVMGSESAAPPPNASADVTSSAPEGEAQTGAAGAEAKTKEEKTGAPITGAFGLTLGERFEPCMVAKVISQEEHRYSGRDKIEATGTIYRVEPKVPNRYFDKYLVKTMSDGRIYWIQGDFEHPEKKKQCKESERVGELLVGKYGLPRGRGKLGEWYAFREMREGPYKGIRLFAPRCRDGRYSIRYADDEVRLTEPAPEPPTEITDLSGL